MLKAAKVLCENGLDHDVSMYARVQSVVIEVDADAEPNVNIQPEPDVRPMTPHAAGVSMHCQTMASSVSSSMTCTWARW